MKDTKTLYNENKAFSKEVPYLQLAWDSTSLGAFKTCPKYYEFNIIQGYTTKIENVHLVFGSHLHTVLEHYDLQKAEGVSHKDALNSSVLKALEITYDKTIGRPWFSDEPAKNRESLVRSIAWYIDKFGENDSMETIKLKNGKPAVELSFRYETGAYSGISNEEYLLCGHIDRLTYWQDAIFGVDRKTSKSAIGQDFFDRFSPDNQISLYMFAGQVVFSTPMKGFVIDAIQVGASFTRFQRGIITRTKSQLDEWFKDLQYWWQLAEIYAEDQYYPMNEKSCGAFGGCPYRKVCGASPEVRPSLLQNLYSRRVWDPLTPRGGL